MPGELPYDPNLVTKTTAQMAAGTYPTAPHPQRLGIVHDPGFEHHDSRMHNLAEIASGIGRILTSEGRFHRAEERVERLQRRIEVAAYIGQRVLNPRGTDMDPKKKLGWVGTSKFHSESITRREEDYSNLGYQLLDIKRVSTAPPVPNTRRPITRSENVADRRIESAFNKAILSAEKSRWLTKSYGRMLHRGQGHRLTMGEQRLMRGTSHDVAEHQERSDKYYDKIHKIADSRDLRGRIARWRLARAQRRVAKGI